MITNDLLVSCKWKSWEDEKPEIGEYFYVLGRHPGYPDEYITLAMQASPMKHLYQEMRYELVDGKTVHVGYYSPRVYECADSSYSFEQCNDFEIEYWINVNDLLPNFLKNDKDITK